MSKKNTKSTESIESIESTEVAPVTSAPTPAPAKGQQAGRRTRFNFDPKPDDQIKQHRSGTKRARVYEMLSSKEGATFDEVSETIGWDKRTTYEGIILIHKALGHGLVEDEKTGKIRLVRNAS